MRQATGCKGHAGLCLSPAARWPHVNPYPTFLNSDQPCWMEAALPHALQGKVSAALLEGEQGLLKIKAS